MSSCHPSSFKLKGTVGQSESFNRSRFKLSSVKQEGETHPGPYLMNFQPNLKLLREFSHCQGEDRSPVLREQDKAPPLSLGLLQSSVAILWSAEVNLGALAASSRLLLEKQAPNIVSPSPGLVCQTPPLGGDLDKAWAGFHGRMALWLGKNPSCTLGPRFCHSRLVQVAPQKPLNPFQLLQTSGEVCLVYKALGEGGQGLQKQIFPQSAWHLDGLGGKLLYQYCP